MNTTERLLKSINLILKENSEDIADDLPEDLPGASELQDFIDEFEKKIAKLLREQKKYYVDAIKAYGEKDDIVNEELLSYLVDDLFVNDKFNGEMASLTNETFVAVVSLVTAIIMESVDPDILFEEMSEGTEQDISEWSKQLALYMNNTTSNALEKEITTAANEGKTIAAVLIAIKGLSVFERRRAANVAIDEILTAFSMGQQESYLQSPAVEKKKWLHTAGTKHPRQNHIQMSGTIVAVDEAFHIAGSSETCMYPRDGNLSPKERRNCQCVAVPVINDEIIRMSKKDKESLRQDFLNRSVDITNKE
ncbi:phage minor head protein [Bacillus cereus group sp. BfR-BA-01328]|uniref:phage minor head protein n=1 Tax=Bacillus cereus group sp. BfR-BA-01328 TaxID=2920304 RepID=UPI001F5610B6